MNLENYKNKGLSGLANLGNTCFINSCIQVLSHTYELSHFLDNEQYKTRLNNKCESTLLLEWDNLRKMMWKENCVISPAKFIRTIQQIAHIKNQTLFTGFLQNDVSEFLLFLMDCFHIALSREIKITVTGKTENETDKLAFKCFNMIKQSYTKDYSEIWNLFYAVHVSEVKRLDNGEVLSITPEPFFMVDLPIPPDHKSPTLNDCFDHYVAGEIVNDYVDENTKETIQVKKRIMFWSFPNVLVIDLKRFNSRFQKNQVPVSFPIDRLDLSPYVVGYKKECYKYELYGICNHSGGVMGGHYTSFVKNANGKWYHFNDTNVTEVESLETIISTKAYVLFYRKIT